MRQIVPMPQQFRQIRNMGALLPWHTAQWGFLYEVCGGIMIGAMPNEGPRNLDAMMRLMGWKPQFIRRRVHLAGLRQLPRWRPAVPMARSATQEERKIDQVGGVVERNLRL